MFDARYEKYPLTVEESSAWNATSSLVTSDAPDWALEMNRVVDRLPSHLVEALPEVASHWKDYPERRRPNGRYTKAQHPWATSVVDRDGVRPTVRTARTTLVRIFAPYPESTSARR